MAALAGAHPALGVPLRRGAPPLCPAGHPHAGQRALRAPAGLGARRGQGCAGEEQGCWVGGGVVLTLWGVAACRPHTAEAAAYSA